jgi:hypothetical protein
MRILWQSSEWGMGVKFLRAVAQIVLASTICSTYKDGKHNIYGVCHDGLSI